MALLYSTNVVPSAQLGRRGKEDGCTQRNPRIQESERTFTEMADNEEWVEQNYSKLMQHPRG